MLIVLTAGVICGTLLEYLAVSLPPFLDLEIPRIVVHIIILFCPVTSVIGYNGEDSLCKYFIDSHHLFTATLGVRRTHLAGDM